MINLTETGVFPLETWGLYSMALVHNFFCPKGMGNLAGSEVTLGQRWQRLIDAELNECLLQSRECHGVSNHDIITLATGRVLVVISLYATDCYGHSNYFYFME